MRAMAANIRSGNARAQVADSERRITAEISRIVTSAENEYRITKAAKTRLIASLEELKDKAGNFNQATVKLRELERDAQANRDLVPVFLNRAKHGGSKSSGC